MSTLRLPEQRPSKWLDRGAKALYIAQNFGLPAAKQAWEQKVTPLVKDMFRRHFKEALAATLENSHIATVLYNEDLKSGTTLEWPVYLQYAKAIRLAMLEEEEDDEHPTPKP